LFEVSHATLSCPSDYSEIKMNINMEYGRFLFMEEIRGLNYLIFV